MIVDMRCPRCNRPLAGKEDVRVGKVWRKTAICQHCKHPVVAVGPKEVDRIVEVYYQSAK